VALSAVERSLMACGAAVQPGAAVGAYISKMAE